MSGFRQTPSQTVGPYLAIGLFPRHPDIAMPCVTQLFDGEMATSGIAGRRIRVEGTIFDGAGEPIPDAMIEVWQADATGVYRTGGEPSNDGFTGFGRLSTYDGGKFVINSVMPGRVAGPDGRPQAPHLTLVVFMRGTLVHAFTRVYFEGETANAEDRILALVPEDRRRTLIARRRSGPGGDVGIYVFDIHMQGDDETVFFDV